MTNLSRRNLLQAAAGLGAFSANVPTLLASPDDREDRTSFDKLSPGVVRIALDDIRQMSAYFQAKQDKEFSQQMRSVKGSMRSLHAQLSELNMHTVAQKYFTGERPSTAQLDALALQVSRFRLPVIRPLINAAATFHNPQDRARFQAGFKAQGWDGVDKGLMAALDLAADFFAPATDRDMRHAAYESARRPARLIQVQDASVTLNCVPSTTQPPPAMTCTSSVSVGDALTTSGNSLMAAGAGALGFGYFYGLGAAAGSSAATASELLLGIGSGWAALGALMYGGGWAADQYNNNSGAWQASFGPAVSKLAPILDPFNLFHSGPY